MLSIVNIILIMVLIAVVCADTVLIFQTRNDIDKMKQKMMDGSSVIDLAEFDALNPELKKQYRKFVVNRAMPQVMKKINLAAEDAHLVDYLNKNEYEVNQSIKEIINQF